MTVLRARWRLFWHCLFQTLWNPTEDHRMETLWAGGSTAWVGCSCGRTFYYRKRA